MKKIFAMGVLFMSLFSAFPTGWGKMLACQTRATDNFCYGKAYADCSEDFKRGWLFSLEFWQAGNDKTSGATISVNLKKPKQELSVEKIVFSFCGKEFVQTINQKFALENIETTQNFIGDENQVFATRLNDCLKFNFYQIFKGYCKDGSKFQMQATVTFHFEDEEEQSLTLNYDVSFFMRDKTAPDWMYWLFPGM